MAEDYNVNIRFTEEETFSGDTGSRAGARDTGEGAGGRAPGRGQDREASDRRRIFQQMEWVFRAFRGVPGVGIMGSIGKDIAVNARFSQQALGLQKGIGGGTIAALAGIGLTIFSLLKQSQISTKFSAAFFQIIGAMIDMLLVPYIPLLSKVVEWLMKGFTWSSEWGSTLFDMVRGAFMTIDGLLKMILGTAITLIGVPIGYVAEGIQRLVNFFSGKGWEIPEQDQMVYDLLKNLGPQMVQGGFNQFTSGVALFSTAVRAFIQSGERNTLIERITLAIQKAIETEGIIANISQLTQQLRTMPLDFLRELSRVSGKQAAVAIPGLALPQQLTPTQLVNVGDALQDALSKVQLTPADLVNLSIDKLLNITQFFSAAKIDLMKYTNSDSFSQIVVGVIAAAAGEANEIKKHMEESRISGEAITKQIDIDTKATQMAAKEVADKMSASKDAADLFLTDIVGAKLNSFVLQLAMQDAAKSSTGIETALKNAWDYIQGMKLTTEGLIDELQRAIAGIPQGVYGPEIQHTVPQASQDWPAWGTADSGIYEQTYNTPTIDPWLEDFHTGGRVKRSGIYNLLQGETILPSGVSQKTININAPINIIAGNQTLMPGILGKSLQASLMEGLENQLVRSLT